MLATLVQIVAYDPVAAASVTLCAASHDDSRLCHLNGQTWWPTVAKLPTLRYDFFDGAFGGQIAAPSSSLTLSAEAWPSFGRYQLADAAVRLWTGELGASWGDFTLRFDGRITSQPQLANVSADIDFAADDRWLDTALLATYAGTTGVEGPASLKGQPKPLALGAPRYVPGTLIDSVNSVFQVSAYGVINGFDAALEKLARFTAPIGDAADYAALIAADIPAGQWATCRAQGLARLGAPPAGQVSFLVRGDAANGWSRKPGQLIRRIAQLAGGGDRLDDASLDALDAAMPVNLSVYLDQQTTARDLIQKIAASVNAVALVSWTGKLLVLPIGLAAPTLTLSADGSTLPPVSAIKQINLDAPFQKLAIGAERAWAVHALSDIAFEAPLIDLGDYVPGTTYREGNIVSLSDGSRWLYVSLTPSAGHQPADDSEFWDLLSGRTRATYDDGTPVEDLKPAEPGATAGAPAGTDVGGVPAEHVIDALTELASTDDPAQLIAGAKALVDRNRQLQLDQLSAQLLGQIRKSRFDTLTHLDGIPVGARVRTEITERQEQGSALAQQIVETEAAITGPNGPIAAAVTQLTEAIADGDHAQALALQALDAEITGPDGPIAAAVTQLTQAVADANSARAEAFNQLQAAITANGQEIDAAFTQLSQAVVTETDARVQADSDLKADITGPDGPIAAAVSQLSLALSNQQSATAQMISDLSASITGPQGALTAAVTNLSQAIANEAGARTTQVTQLTSTVGGNTASIEVLFQTVNGEQAVAQIAVTVDENGTPKVTGFKIDGQEHAFYLEADLIVFGDSKLFKIDTVNRTISLENVEVNKIRAASVDTDALVDHSVTGFVSIDGLGGQISPDDTSTSSDALVFTTKGGVVRLDVNFDVRLIAGQNPSFFMQLYRNGGPITREFRLNPSTNTTIGFPAFFTLVDTPPAGQQTYQLFFSRYSGGGSPAAGLIFEAGSIYAQEFKK